MLKRRGKLKTGGGKIKVKSLEKKKKKGEI